MSACGSGVGGADLQADSDVGRNGDGVAQSSDTANAGVSDATTGAAGDPLRQTTPLESDPGPMATDDAPPHNGSITTYGGAYTGGVYNLGPVDYAETAFHNACAPGSKYPPAIQAIEGDMIAGLWEGITNVASYCDACIYVETASGKSALLRVVTYGQTASNSIDVSTSAFAVLSDGEYPRDMTWHLAKCDDTGPVVYEFQDASSEWWTSLWVRNARVPLSDVSVMSANHGSFVSLVRGSDGTLTDNSGFGKGTFTIRLTGVDGQVVTDTFSWPSSGIGGAMLTGQGNFE